VVVNLEVLLGVCFEGKKSLKNEVTEPFSQTLEGSVDWRSHSREHRFHWTWSTGPNVIHFFFYAHAEVSVFNWGDNPLTQNC